MKLSLNQKYIISTKESEEMIDVKVEVVGIINYESTKKIPYSVEILAIAEKVLDENGDPESFLKDITFYHLKEIDTGKDYIIWDDVIDPIKSNPLDVTFSYRMRLTVSSTMNVPISTILDNIENYIDSTYGSVVQPLITEIQGDDSTELELLMKKVSVYESTLDAMEKLGGVLNQVERLSSSDITNQISDIQTNIAQISSDLSKISSVI